MIINEKPMLSDDLVQSIVLNNGITDLDLFLNPDDSNDTQIETIPNIQQALEMFDNHIQNKNNILILVDSDADGMTSAAIMYRYIRSVDEFANVSYFVHKTKTHGITQQFLNHVYDVKPKMVIIPDAGTNDIKQRESLTEIGVDVLIIDHHKEDKTTQCGGILINNHAQYPQNNLNKNLTGATMTYTVCKAFDKMKYMTNSIDKLKDLAMVGSVGDCASVIENETRNICMTAIDNIQSDIIKTIIKENKQDINNVTLTDMQFGGIIPLINAVIRIGTIDDKELMFKALADIDSNIYKIVEKRKLNKETRKYERIPFKLNLYQLAIDTARECRSKQTKIINEEMKIVNEQFNEKQGIQVYIIENDESKLLTGLLANKLSSLWQQPILAVWKIDNKYVGSLRGYEKSLKSLKAWCESTNLFSLVQGHDNAAGIAFDVDKLDLIKKQAENVEYEEAAYYVDKLYENNALKDDIFNIYNARHIFKNGVEQPLFAIKNVKITPNNVKWSKNTLRIILNGITYIKFKTPEDEYNELIKSNKTLTIVGTFDVNEWNENMYPQVHIKEYDINEQNENIQKNENAIDYGIFG